jgi:probable HAF family extracellular repeat protein
MTPLPTLGGNNGFGMGMNNRHEEVGTAENTTPDPDCGVYQQKPVIWRRGEIHELPTFQGDTIGAARQINDWGQATGWSGTCAAGRLHALLWQNGTPIDLGNLGGTIDIAPWDINNQGQVVGNSYLPDNTTVHGFLWQKSTGMIDLGTLPGDVFSSGAGINNKGQVVGGSADASYNERAYLWQNGVMTDLNTLISPDSPLYLLEADGINDRGQIEGYALNIIAGEVHAFLATPTRTYAAISERPKVVLTENVRKLLQQRRGGRFGVGVTRLH